MGTQVVAARPVWHRPWALQKPPNCWFFGNFVAPERVFFRKFDFPKTHLSLMGWFWGSVGDTGI